MVVLLHSGIIILVEQCSRGRTEEVVGLRNHSGPASKGTTATVGCREQMEGREAAALPVLNRRRCSSRVPLGITAAAPWPAWQSTGGKTRRKTARGCG